MTPTALRTQLVALASTSFLLVASAMAEIPQYLSYQGRITDAGGTPVTDGPYAMRFRIYNDATGGSLLWDSGSQTVSTSQGVASVLLGESPQPALTLSFSADYWLLVTFQGTDQSPRVRLTSAGYSYMASGLVPGTVVDGEVTSGSYPGSVAAINQAATGANYGGYFRSLSTSGTGVFGFGGASSGSNHGVQGVTNSPDGKAVYGQAGSSTGDAYGVFGRSYSSSGYGVYGYASASTGTNCGVLGKTNSSDGFGVVGLQPGYSLGDIGAQPEAGGLFCGTTGVIGLHKTGGGHGVLGWAKNTSGSGSGVLGMADSNQGIAVNGWATRASGQTWGGFFRSDADSGTGVEAQATASTGVTCGVYGLSASTAGYGMCGIGSASTGVNYGVYGRTNSPSGYAGYFQGNARVTGNLTVDGTLSGSGLGDITSVNAGGGLAGGGNEGDVWLSLSAPMGLSWSGPNPTIQGVNTFEGSYGIRGENSALTGLGAGVYGSTQSSQGAGVSGRVDAQEGAGAGVMGYSASTAGRGVYGMVSKSTGLTYGVFGETFSSIGRGVYGHATSSIGENYGIYGETESTAGYAGYFAGNTRVTGNLIVDGTLSGPGIGDITSVNAGTGLTGGASSGDATLDVQVPLSLSGSNSGAVISGSSTATTGESYGGSFSSSSADGIGAYGSVTPPSPADRIGVAGYCKPANYYGIGVVGEGGYYGVSGICSNSSSSNSAYGVRGSASGASVSYGVYGSASGATTNWGVYASGNLGASGTKSAIVRTNDGPKAVYCQESTEVWFEDFGSGEIRNGQALVSLAEDFLQTVVINDEHRVKVFITPKARIGVWWVKDGTREFRLLAPDAPDGSTFDYRVVAKRFGYENVRLEPRAEGYADHFLYPSIGDVPAAHQAEWLKADAVRKEAASKPAGDR